jgi:hypothetical protein
MDPIIIFKVSLPHNDFRRFNSATFPKHPRPSFILPSAPVFSLPRRGFLRFTPILALCKTSGDVHATLTNSRFQLRPHPTQSRNVASPPTVTPSARVYRGVAFAIDNSVSHLRQLFIHAHLLDGPHAHRPLPFLSPPYMASYPSRKSCRLNPALHFG